MEDLKPLPDVDGPKLGPFGHDMLADDVEFLELSQQETGHGWVMKIKIGDKCYALKIFFNKDTGWGLEDMYKAGPTSSMSWGDFEKHFTPFENECRAYGRLKELGREHLAVKVHGYVVMSATEALTQKLQLLESKDAHSRSISKRLGQATTLMGIVKDWVDRVVVDPSLKWDFEQAPQDEIRQVRHFPRMLRDLHKLHESGIVVRDVGIWQYLDGVLVDLSMAWTMPHPFGPGRGWKPRWEFQSWAASDLHSFQVEVIEEWRDRMEFDIDMDLPQYKGIPRSCSLRAYESQEWARVLRPRPDRQRPFMPLLNKDNYDLDMVQLPRHDPGEFDPARISMPRKKRKGEDATGGSAKRRKGLEVKGSHTSTG
ncbi:hypothetical protein BHE90_011181 [Fusarium euwallaceae]|uniref:Uncharacterized protein n=4 Tax=Fusarium solani species complex TaxID=232080 RepID=A0A3M2RU96_9HYPO|nr:hypothetical protein CDV36_011502 [Fusarium kuroshium]RSL62805.1 hypothetical protein CEP51_013409 [Fusarium floridanum]RSL86069.1 hypothetical protein CEP52_015942 [Fusarium oligoseptatum]RTE74370.1 hypothetical protein BHE90_011181 [Fusarium euwallaceae]